MPRNFKPGWRFGVVAALLPVLAAAVDVELTSSWDSFLVWSSDSGTAPTIATAGFTVVDPDGDGRDDIILGVTEPLSAFRRVSYSAPDARYFIDRSVPNPYPLADQLDPQLRLVTSLTPGGALKAITWQKHSIAIYDLASGRLERLGDPSGYDSPVPVCAIDLDGDGAKEIVIRDATFVHVANTTLTRELSVIRTAQSARPWNLDAVCGNFDADPSLEVAIDNGEIYEFSGFTLHLQGTVDAVANGTPQFAGTADIDGDHNDELFVVYAEVGSVRVHNLESSAPAWSVSLAGAQILAARVVDINRDDVKDLLVVTLKPDNTGEIVGFSGVNGHELVRIATPDGGVFAVNAGNFDGDPGIEIAVVLFRPFTRPNRMYVYNAASGALEWRSEDEVGPITAAAMHDLDGDGKSEVVVAVRAVYGVGDIRLLAFDANTFQRLWATSQQILPVTGTGPIASLAMGDVDGDGDNEIAIGLQKDGIAQVVILDGATRAFVRMIPLAGFENVEAIALHDFDGDGDAEIVAAASAPYPSTYGGETFILDGVSGQTVAHAGLGTYHSRHLTAVRVGDVTGDGRPDVVTAGTSAEGLGGTVFVMDGVTHAARGEVSPEIGHDGLALLDVNGDGVAEIALGNSDGAIDVRRGSDLASIRRLTPCNGRVWALATNNLAGASAGDAYYACDDRVGTANLRAGGAAHGISGMVSYRAGIGNVLLATGTAAAPRIVTSSILGLRHLTPSSAIAPYIVPGNHQNGPEAFAGHWRGQFTGQISFGSYTNRATTVQLIEGPASGTFKIEPDGAFTMTAGAPQRVEHFTVRVNDGAADSVPMTFAILVTNSAPFVPFQSLEFTATVGTTLSTAVNAQDADLDPMTFTLVTAPTKGVVQLASSGAFTYLASAGATGDDTFTYFARDASDRSTRDATVVIHLQPAVAPPPPPVTNPDPPPSSGGGGGGGEFDVFSLLLLALLCTYAQASCARRRTRRQVSPCH